MSVTQPEGHGLKSHEFTWILNNTSTKQHETHFLGCTIAPWSSHMEILPDKQTASVSSVRYKTKFDSQNFGYQLWCVFSCDQAALQMVFSVRLSVRLSVCLSVTPFSPCSHHRIIMKFSGVITMVKSDVHAKGQGQRSRSQRSTPNLAVSGL